MHRYTAALLVAIGLMAPLAVAQDRDRDRQTKRYYDTHHKDYHEWNENEARNYTRYLNERKLRQRAFERQRRAEQQRYWMWRHEHPDERR